MTRRDPKRDARLLDAFKRGDKRAVHRVLNVEPRHERIVRKKTDKIAGNVLGVVIGAGLLYYLYTTRARVIEQEKLLKQLPSSATP